MILPYKEIKESSIRNFPDNVNRKILCRHQILSYVLIKKFRNKVHWGNISKYQVLTETFIEKFQHEFQKLTTCFISKFCNMVNWENISYYQVLTETFVDLYPDKVVWNNFFMKNPSEQDRLNWTDICETAKLSNVFIRNHLHLVTKKQYQIR
jgi:hypothetical protein